MCFLSLYLCRAVGVDFTFYFSLSIVSVNYENDLGGNFFQGKLMLALSGEHFAGVKSFSFLFFFFFFSSFWEIIAWCSWRCLIVFFFYCYCGVEKGMSVDIA